MSAHLQKGMLLHQQGRHQLAVEELLRHLGTEPQCVDGHMALALCFAELEQRDRAIEYAKAAIGLAPDMPETHYVLARVYLDFDQAKLSLHSINNAIDMDPEEADYWGIQAAGYLRLHEWQKAADAARNGMNLDPEHGVCTNCRVLALTHLGRRDEAEIVARGQLSSDPENPVTHASTGWACLHKGDSRKAQEHFRESLRLDPESEWARSGLIESIKSRNPVYWLFLRYFLWMGSFKPGVRMTLIIGAVVLVNVIGRIGDSAPAMAPVAGAVQVLYFIFVCMVWAASPFFNMLLLFHPLGRHALNVRQKATSYALMVTMLFILGFTAFLLVTIRGGAGGWVYALPFLIMFPVLTACKAKWGLPLIGMTAYVVVMIVAFLLPMFGYNQGLQVYTWGCVLSTWIANAVPRA